MRTTIVVATGILTLFASAPSITQARLSEKHICKAHPLRILAASRKVRVFVAAVEKGPYEESLTDCAVWVPTGKITKIGYVSEVKIAGPYVAYPINTESSEEGRYNPSGPYREKMMRLDVKDGRRTASPAILVPDESRRPRVHFALTPAGSVAWSFTEPPWVNASVVYLLPADSDTTTRLAQGPTVEPASLALVPGHLYWLEGGMPHSVAVP